MTEESRGAGMTKTQVPVTATPFVEGLSTYKAEVVVGEPGGYLSNIEASIVMPNVLDVHAHLEEDDNGYYLSIVKEPGDVVARSVQAKPKPSRLEEPGEQVIPSGAWTQLMYAEGWVYQETGAAQKVTVDPDGEIKFGAPMSYRAIDPFDEYVEDDEL